MKNKYGVPNYWVLIPVAYYYINYGVENFGIVGGIFSCFLGFSIGIHLILYDFFGVDVINILGITKLGSEEVGCHMWRFIFWIMAGALVGLPGSSFFDNIKKNQKRNDV